MRLENLYQNFNLASSATQAAMIAEYRARRATDMDKPNPWLKKSKGSKTPVAPLTPDEKILINLMGIKKKDVLALRKLK